METTQRRRTARRRRPAPIVGRVAEPLPAPTTPYSKGQWDLARRRWRWNPSYHVWRCCHHKELCPDCGATPDMIAIKAGAERAPATWRKSSDTDQWICCLHHRGTCAVCGTRPAVEEPAPAPVEEIVDIRPQGREHVVKRAAKTFGFLGG